MVWGWRPELQLGAATAALQLLSLDISPVGPLLVLAAQVGILLKRPDVRARFETTASRQHEVAKLHYACLLSGLVNSRGEIPQVIKHAPLSVGRRYLMRLPVGIPFEAVEQRAQTLASSLAAKSVRVTAVRENAQLFELAVIRKDAFPQVLAPSTNLQPGGAISLRQGLHTALVIYGLRHHRPIRNVVSAYFWNVVLAEASEPQGSPGAKQVTHALLLGLVSQFPL